MNLTPTAAPTGRFVQANGRSFHLLEMGQGRPVFFLHGTDDRVVPFNHSEQLYAAANEPKHFLRLHGFGHSPLIGDVFTTELVKFLNEHAP